MLSLPYYLFFKSYLNKKHFAVRFGAELSSISPIHVGVPQDAVSSTTFYNLYTSYQPTQPNTQVAEYPDDKVIYSTNMDPKSVSTSTQNHLNLLSTWCSQ